MLDRATILRDAHAQVRKMRIWGGAQGTYRQLFAQCLRLSWYAAKAAAADAAWEAAQPPIPSNIQAEAAAMRSEAWLEPITTSGNARMVAGFLAASALIEGARQAYA